MNADDTLRIYEANKKEIEEMKEEEKQIEALQDRLLEIDNNWSKEIKKIAKANHNLQKLGKVWGKTHQPDRRKRCEELVLQKRAEIEQIKQKINGLAKERNDILSKIHIQRIP